MDPKLETGVSSKWCEFQICLWNSVLQNFYYVRIPDLYIYKVLIRSNFYIIIDEQQHELGIMENILSEDVKTNETDNRKQFTKCSDSTNSGDNERQEFTKENKNRKDESANGHLHLTNIDKDKNNDKVSNNVNLKMVSVVYGFTGDTGTNKTSREKHDFVVVGHSKKLPYKRTDIIFSKDGKKKMTDWIKNDEFITETEEGVIYREKYGCYTVCTNPWKRKKLSLKKDT